VEGGATATCAAGPRLGYLYQSYLPLVSSLNERLPIPSFSFGSIAR